MAVDESKFSHITVTTEDEDDEVVIHAGSQNSVASEDEDEEVIELQEEPAVEEEPVVEEESVAEDEPVVEEEQVVEEYQELEEEPESQAIEKSEESEADNESASSENSKDEYHETTLEDLEESKMPITERIFIVIAGVAIIAFVLWYVFVYLGS